MSEEVRILRFVGGTLSPPFHQLPPPQCALTVCRCPHHRNHRHLSSQCLGDLQGHPHQRTQAYRRASPSSEPAGTPSPSAPESTPGRCCSQWSRAASLGRAWHAIRTLPALLAGKRLGRDKLRAVMAKRQYLYSLVSHASCGMACASISMGECSIEIELARETGDGFWEQRVSRATEMQSYHHSSHCHGM